jgi:(2R)-3-sulfolactate dehydrogenase (NADP+)
MPRIPVEEAESLVQSALQRAGTRQASAQSVARALVRAEADGQPGHGLSRVASYAAQVRAGKVKGDAVPHLTYPKPGVGLIDAGHGFAYPALDLAIDALPERAATQGVAAMGIHRSHHCGAAGIVVERLAEQGLVALLFANTPAAMTPWSGARAVFGTNPIAFACPLPGKAPIVIDMSLSKVARGQIMRAHQRGEPIPEGWALDAAGKSTTDASAALKGSMVPMGDAKGAALALMVELLAAGLTGATFAADASSFLDAAGDPPGTGQLIIALKADVFHSGAVDRFAALASAITQQDGARLPGHRRNEQRAKAMAQGLDVDDAVLTAIKAL